jgi:hypothetical protein
MTLLDCTSCGGPLNPERGCCPHCHCKLSGKKRIAAIAAAAFLASCGGGTESIVPYGPAPVLDLAGADDSVVDTADLLAPPHAGDAGNE